MPRRVRGRPLTRPVRKRRVRTEVDPWWNEGLVVVLGFIREWRRRKQLPTRAVENHKAIEFLRTRLERRQFFGVVADWCGVGDQTERATVMDSRGIRALDQSQVVRKRVIGFERRPCGT